MNLPHLTNHRLPLWGIIALAAASLTIAALRAAAAGVKQPTSTVTAFTTTAQADSDSDSDEVPANEVEKYVAVYKAMHRDRTLTVEQAAAQQGMTVMEFRQLENRVQRDDAALQHVRDELQESAVHASASASPAAPAERK